MFLSLCPLCNWNRQEVFCLFLWCHHWRLRCETGFELIISAAVKQVIPDCSQVLPWQQSCITEFQVFQDLVRSLLKMLCCTFTLCSESGRQNSLRHLSLSHPFVYWGESVAVSNNMLLTDWSDGGCDSLLRLSVCHLLLLINNNFRL